MRLRGATCSFFVRQTWIHSQFFDAYEEKQFGMALSQCSTTVLVGLKIGRLTTCEPPLRQICVRNIQDLVHRCSMGATNSKRKISLISGSLTWREHCVWGAICCRESIQWA